MTKYRPPASFASALHRISDQLGGMKVIASIAERELSTVNAWANDDLPQSVPVNIMLKLDLAHRRAGGVGSPLRDAYDVLFDCACADEFSDIVQLSVATAIAAKEFGDFGEAAIMAAQPGADLADLVRAKHEAQEALAAVTAVETELGNEIKKRQRRSAAATPSLPP